MKLQDFYHIERNTEMGKIIRNKIPYSSSGSNGKSAYEVWLSQGNEGTEEDFLNSLKCDSASDVINDETTAINTTFSSKKIQEILETSYIKTYTSIEDLNATKGSNLVISDNDICFDILSVLNADEGVTILEVSSKAFGLTPTEYGDIILKIEFIKNSANKGVIIAYSSNGTISTRETAYGGLEEWRHGVSPEDISNLRDLIELNKSTDFVVSGEIDLDNKIVTIYQTFEDISLAKFEGQSITPSFIVKSGEETATYIFNVLYSLGEAIAFEWFNSSAKLGIQVTLLEDDTTSLAITDLNEELEEIKKSVSDGKITVAGAITDNGVETATDATFEVMAENINMLSDRLKVPNGTEWTLLTEYEKSPNIYYKNMWFLDIDSKLYYSENGLEFKPTSLDGGSELPTTSALYPQYMQELGVWVNSRGNGELGYPTYYSQDGKNWFKSNLENTEVTTFIEGNGVVIGINSYQDSNSIYYTTNGKVWNKASGITSSIKYFTNILYVGNMFFAVPSSTSHPTYYSQNGKEWFNLSTRYYSIIYENGLYFARTSSNVFYSVDGITWTACNCSDVIGHSTYGIGFTKVIYRNGKWVGATYSGIYYSNDGKSWVKVSGMSGNYAIYFNKGVWVCAGIGGPSNGSKLYYSTDGEQWIETNISAPTYGSIYEYNGRLFYIRSNVVYTSEDNKTWTQIEQLTLLLGYYNELFMGSNFRYSIDGVNWTDSNITEIAQATSGTKTVYFGNGMWLAKVDKKIYYSRAVPWIEKN